MSDEWLAKCLKAAKLPLGDVTAFDQPDQPGTLPQKPSQLPSQRQGIEIGLTATSVVVVLHNPGDKPQHIKLSPEDSMNLAENLKKAAMLLLFRNSFRTSGIGSEDSGPSDESESKPT